MPSISAPGPVELLPFGAAFRFVEAIVTHETGRVVTRMTWPLDDPRIRAHMPGGPYIVPGVLLAEQVAQSALLLARLEGRLRPEGMLSLGMLRCEFRAPARAPCEVQAEVHFQASVRGRLGFIGICHVARTEVARVKGIAAPMPAEPDT